MGEGVTESKSRACLRPATSLDGTGVGVVSGRTPKLNREQQVNTHSILLQVARKVDRVYTGCSMQIACSN